ncbi:MAG: 7-cyano-7-deazaguanine synthase QueC [SAR202 cluster bacterium]|nr:7-cyano-7-deazaguanine synthase QueC [SAR202 cluster bacterium]
MAIHGVSLLSGGLDSTTVTAYARSRCDSLTALTFRYGQTHSKEADCATEIAARLGVEHRLIDISFLKDVAWYSALTNPKAFPVPKGTTTEQIGASIPITYVPLRNTIFISLAAAYLESKVLHAIETGGQSARVTRAVIYMAPNAVDFSGYPDCRPEFFEQVARTLGFGSKLGTQYGVNFDVVTPIIHLSKAEIVRLAGEVNAPIDLTWSCYEGGDSPCGQCDSCVLRAKGFVEAGVPDPLLVRLGKAGDGNASR